MPKSLPREILRDLPWSFKEDPLPDLASFIESLRDYGDDIDVPLDEAGLQRLLPTSAVDVKYAYGVRAPSGEWHDAEEIVRIRSDHVLSCAELLYQIHTRVHDRLQHQDHCFFEGLSLLTESTETGVPTYEMNLGN